MVIFLPVSNFNLLQLQHSAALCLANHCYGTEFCKKRVAGQKSAGYKWPIKLWRLQEHNVTGGILMIWTQLLPIINIEYSAEDSVMYTNNNTLHFYSAFHLTIWLHFTSMNEVSLTYISDIWTISGVMPMLWTDKLGTRVMSVDRTWNKIQEILSPFFLAIRVSFLCSTQA